MYLAWLSLGWGLVLAGTLLTLRCIRAWLITALTRHRLADGVSLSSADFAPPMRPHLYQLTHTESVRVPSRDPPPLYEDVVGGYNMYADHEVVPHFKVNLHDAQQPGHLPHTVLLPPPVYSELYPTECLHQQDDEVEEDASNNEHRQDENQ